MLFPKGSTVLLHPRMMAYATAIITVSVHKCLLFAASPRHVTTQTVQKCELRLRKDLSFVSAGNNALVYSFPMSI